MTDILSPKADAPSKAKDETNTTQPLDALRIDPEAAPIDGQVVSRTVLGNGAVLEHLA